MSLGRERYDTRASEGDLNLKITCKIWEKEVICVA